MALGNGKTDIEDLQAGENPNPVSSRFVEWGVQFLRRPSGLLREAV